MVGGERVVAKHQVFAASVEAPADDLLEVEARVLELLAAASCPVPRVLGTDPETRFIFFEHRGRSTLDDLCQTMKAGSAALSRAVVGGFCEIESVFAARREELVPLESQAGTRRQLALRDRRSLRGAEEGLARLAGGSRATKSEIRHLIDLLRAITERLGSRPPTLGCMDYNARNIVVEESTHRPCFIEFAKIGWDWPERRLVQYATSMGAGREDGSFVGLIDCQVTDYYAAQDADDHPGKALALDGHHLHFSLNAFAMLAGAVESPDRPANRALLDVWRRPPRRLRQLVQAVARPLSDDPMCGDFRRSVAALAGHDEEE